MRSDEEIGDEEHRDETQLDPDRHRGSSEELVNDDEKSVGEESQESNHSHENEQALDDLAEALVEEILTLAAEPVIVDGYSDAKDAESDANMSHDQIMTRAMKQVREMLAIIAKTAAEERALWELENAVPEPEPEDELVDDNSMFDLEMELMDIPEPEPEPVEETPGRDEYFVLCFTDPAV